MTFEVEEADAAPDEYEAQYVHEVYEQIAEHFSQTRYKPWPIVSTFLQGLCPGSIGIDVGCGNGKYLGVNPNVFIIASDRSCNLVKIAQAHEPHDAIVADSLSLPNQAGRLDFAISIAVIHHLCTRHRRQTAIKSIIDCLRLDGKALIYVWALEQKGSRRGWDEGGQQDVMVPWIMNSQAKENPCNGKKFQRYYHLYCKGELEEDIGFAGGKVIDSGYERDNWWVICQRYPIENTISEI
ncbi:BgTH12-01129 [Blumeria graminis f. sp. triticale]|uniref:BgTH12-01129 n=1 Tax=Blumeria graminis f. sp. triticale TaxID=1689686 RepID=A0A9W4D7V3_BLUGR|nr:BgTH12-01129 [Blumeria graminis f. sp. triticale]